jgi:hypothetical protein
MSARKAHPDRIEKANDFAASRFRGQISTVRVKIRKVVSSILICPPQKQLRYYLTGDFNPYAAYIT